MILNLASCVFEAVAIGEVVLLEIVTVAEVTRQNDTLLRGWSKQYGRPITLTELEEINFNLSHLFSVLLSWEREFKEQGLITDVAGSADTRV